MLPHKTVLNIGCGYRDLLFARPGGVELVIGIDYSKKSIDQAKRYYPHPRVKRFVVELVQPDGDKQEFEQF